MRLHVPLSHIVSLEDTHQLLSTTVFPGIIRHHSDEPVGAVREIKWIDAETWASKGGSEIGTNRGLPSEDLETVAFVFRKFGIQALFVVGGFEAFTSVSELRKAREYYKSFKIPMVSTESFKLLKCLKS